MAKGKLSEEEQQILCENPNVIRVNENRIMYSDNFKRTFQKEFAVGKKPAEIFVAAGFDKKMLGGKRIERAAARWREMDCVLQKE